MDAWEWWTFDWHQPNIDKGWLQVGCQSSLSGHPPCFLKFADTLSPFPFPPQRGRIDVKRWCTSILSLTLLSGKSNPPPRIHYSQQSLHIYLHCLLQIPPLFYLFSKLANPFALVQYRVVGFTYYIPHTLYIEKQLSPCISPWVTNPLKTAYCLNAWMQC